MKTRLSHRLAGAAATGILAIASHSAHALIAEVDTFKIVKNGTELFVDTFSDGVAPPAAPGEFATYLYPRGDFLEANGKLILNPASGPIAANAAGALSSTTRITFSTNIVPEDQVTGLKSNHVFSVSATFALLDNTVPQDSYGLRLTDRDALGQLGVGTNGDDVIELRVNHGANGRNLQFRRQNFLPGGGITVLGSPAISQAWFDRYEQVELTLEKTNANSNEISARARLIDADDPNASLTINWPTGTTTSAFNGENWTRAEIYAAQAPIPEPETYAMLLAGLGLVGWQLRRRAKRDAASRIA